MEVKAMNETIKNMIERRSIRKYKNKAVDKDESFIPRRRGGI